MRRKKFVTFIFVLICVLPAVYLPAYADNTYYKLSCMGYISYPNTDYIDFRYRPFYAPLGNAGSGFQGDNFYYYYLENDIVDTETDEFGVNIDLGYNESSSVPVLDTYTINYSFYVFGTSIYSQHDPDSPMILPPTQYKFYSNQYTEFNPVTALDSGDGYTTQKYYDLLIEENSNTVIGTLALNSEFHTSSGYPVWFNSGTITVQRPDLIQRLFISYDFLHSNLLMNNMNRQYIVYPCSLFYGDILDKDLNDIYAKISSFDFDSSGIIEQIDALNTPLSWLSETVNQIDSTIQTIEDKVAEGIRSENEKEKQDLLDSQSDDVSGLLDQIPGVDSFNDAQEIMDGISSGTEYSDSDDMSFVFPALEFRFLGQNMHFWDSYSFDFDDFFDMDVVQLGLVPLRFLIGFVFFKNCLYWINKIISAILQEDNSWIVDSAGSELPRSQAYKLKKGFK